MQFKEWSHTNNQQISEASMRNTESAVGIRMIQKYIGVSIESYENTELN